MKKLLFILALILLVGLFASCNDDRGNAELPKEKEYEYCTTRIVSGSEAVHPICVRLGYSEYKNNKLVDTVELAEIEDVFGYNVDEFPTIILDGTPDANPPVNVLIHNIKVYDTEFNLLKFSFQTIRALSELPRGEYVIIYEEEADGRGCSPDITDFRINRSAGVFKLVVR